MLVVFCNWDPCWDIKEIGLGLTIENKLPPFHLKYLYACNIQISKHLKKLDLCTFVTFQFFHFEYLYRKKPLLVLRHISATWKLFTFTPSLFNVSTKQMIKLSSFGWKQQACSRHLTMATFGKNLPCNGEQPRGALAKELLLPLEQMHRLSFAKPWPSFLLLHLTPHPKPTSDPPSKAHKWTSPIYPKTIMFNMAFWDTIKQYSLLHKFDTN